MIPQPVFHLAVEALIIGGILILLGAVWRDHRDLARVGVMFLVGTALIWVFALVVWPAGQS